jgi:hypothetical protein
VRRFAKRLQRLVRSVRDERHERLGDDDFSPAMTEGERRLYRDLIDAEFLLRQYKSGGFRVKSPRAQAERPAGA